MIELDYEFMGIAVRTLIGVLVCTIILFGIVIYGWKQYQKEWADKVVQQGFTDFESQTGATKPQYVLWIGDVMTTLDVLDLAQQPGMVIQPIYIPDPANSSARTEYELQITRTLRQMINTKYPQSKLLPIISITRERPDDDAFNREYDMGAEDGASDALTRENILRRWAKYYKLNIAQPSGAKTNRTQPKKKTSNTRILSETWNCRFPVGADGTPCGLCKKCEKLFSIS